MISAKLPKADQYIEPQPGFQTNFLSTSADIAIGGGSAGGGKTFAELLEATRHVNNPLFGAVFFRRTTVQITNQGGLWDSSTYIYPNIGAIPNISRREWLFPGGAKLKFTHLEHENNIYDHQGAQYALIVFDELTHFTKKQFFYLLSRNRSMCGIRPYVRATTNPDPDSWVAGLIEWWIDQETGYPIGERAGVLRYLLVHDENYVWGNTKQEVIDQLPPNFFERFPEDVDPFDLIKSVTFIPGSVYENKALLQKDPGYLANLMAQDDDEKARLLDGNWKIRLDNLCLFNHYKINDLFTNYPPTSTIYYITCDAARFGRDYTVIGIWQGWLLVRMIVLMSSDEQDIVGAIEGERQQFHIPKSNVLIDQDGVGGGAVGLGGYMGFSGGASAVADPQTGIIESYKNLKTQCYYRYSERVNTGQVGFVLNNETVVIHERSGRQLRGVKIKIGSKETTVIDLMKADHRAIKKGAPDPSGKKKINPKEEQKLILEGRSPDFGDMAMMREWFELFGIMDYSISRVN